MRALSSLQLEMGSVRWRCSRCDLGLPHVAAGWRQAELAQIDLRRLRVRARVLQIYTDRGDAEVRRLDIGEGRHVFVTRDDSPARRGTGHGSSSLRLRNWSWSWSWDSHWRRCQLDFIDSQGLDDNHRPGSFQSGAVLFRAGSIQVALDHDAPAGEQLGNALLVGLKQPRQVLLDQLPLGARHQLPGEGNLVEAHGHTPVQFDPQYGAVFFAEQPMAANSALVTLVLP